jgi:hypothetical protein
MSIEIGIIYGKSIQSTKNEIGLIIRRHPYGRFIH